MEYGKIYIIKLKNGGDNWNGYLRNDFWKNALNINYTKYNIKETDMRIKTATFTSPSHIDLTLGMCFVKITSKYHENFYGVVLDCEYDNDTGLYDYQCQDFSRLYTDKREVKGVSMIIYDLIRVLASHGIHFFDTKNEKKLMQEYGHRISGIRPKELYNQALWKGNGYKSNFMAGGFTGVVRGKTEIEAIRDVVFSRPGYYDVYFDGFGHVQVKPLSKDDWENTGLVLSDTDYYNSKYKFSTTNAITHVDFDASGNEIGKNAYGSSDVVGLDLSAFFGKIYSTTSDPANNKNNSKAVSNSKSTAKSTSTVNNKYGNPFNNRPKKVWINADGGSDGLKRSFINALTKAGWSVHDGGTNSNYHINQIKSVPSNYSVYATMYNGFDPATIREAYETSYAFSSLQRKGVLGVVLWDTREWTNPHGMKPHRYGDFTGYYPPKAWDDNYSSGGYYKIGDADKFFRKHKAVYCAGPTASDLMKHWNAGGYYNYKGIKV